MRTVVSSTAAHSNAISVFAQARFQGVVDNFERLDARVALVVALEDYPGGERRAGQAEDILDRGFVLGILVAVAPILIGDLPLFRRILLAVAKASQLLFGTHVNPELQQDGAPPHQIALEFVDLVVRPRPFRHRSETFDALHEHATVPAAVVDAHVARLRQTRPIAPQVRMQQLGLRGGGTGKNGIGAGVERLGHALDVAALARGVPAFVHDHERDALLVHLHLQPVEALLLGLELDLVRLGVERERVVDALEARRVVHLTEPRNARSAGGSRKKADSRRKSSCVC